ncbi:uL11 family ribosomal protein [Streptomyces xantholiticus]|uniref:uL11 family ribosomal protein n=1 Tax=Streptomyces xantholiticus TaxID=68285 RepID=UPI001672439E|nr:50S ribosomal protein L11 [Streptomyces xantholiticus]GGW61428.1 50S ribosomal protein L11 [Streptomyces xantholiticus]
MSTQPQPKKKLKINATVRVRQPAGNANVAKIGQVLGAHGVNIAGVMKEFNAATAVHSGLEVSADVIIFEDRSFELAVKTPTAAGLLRQAAGVQKGSSQPHTEQAGTITREQLRQIATTKLPDLNTDSVEEAERIVAGSARSMGIKVVD